MKFLKRLFVVLVALLMLALVALYLTPLDVYIPEVEKALSMQLHEPVRIHNLRIAVLPLPHLQLQGLYLGDKEGITAQSVDVELDIASLFAGKKLMWRISVRDGAADYAQVRKLTELMSHSPAVMRGGAVRELQMSMMRLLTPKVSLGPVEGKLEFDQSGALERAWFAVDEQKAVAILLPLPNRHFAVKAEAHAWSLPQFTQIKLDSLQVEGVLSEQNFVAQKFSVALRGAHVSGSGKVEYSDELHIQSKLDEADVPLEKLMAIFGSQLDLSGTLKAKGLCSSKGSTLSELKDNFQFAGDVGIDRAAFRVAAEFVRSLLFDEISAHVAADSEHIAVSALVAKLYDGKLSGSAAVTRKDGLLKADVWGSNIAMQQLVEALTNEMLFSGRMDGSARLAMHIDALARFPEGVQLDGNFHLQHGVLSKVDLVQAASNPGKIPEKIGATRFDDLTGLLRVDADGFHFRKIRIASGSFNAVGRADISPALQLSGTMDADVKGTAGLVSMPMVISGTLSKPVVRPSGTALAGAAVGTAILGPGLGTAVGIKIGGFLNKLFGKPDENASKDGVVGIPVIN